MFVINRLEGWIVDIILKELLRNFKVGFKFGFGVGFIAGSGIAMLAMHYRYNHQVSHVACTCLLLW